MMVYAKKIFEPSEAAKKARWFFEGAGFLTIKRSNGSFYVKRKLDNGKWGRMVRISDHKTEKKVDLLHDLVFDYKTIEPDIKARVEKVIRVYR